jgi:hypothetical protein
MAARNILIETDPDRIGRPDACESVNNASSAGLAAATAAVGIAPLMITTNPELLI